MSEQNVAGFIDVGFLRAVVASATGKDTGRVRLDASAVAALVGQTAEQMSAPVLRTYWYDGQHSVEDPRFASQKRYFDAVAATPGIQLRLGALAARTPPWQGDVVRALAEFGITREQFARYFPFQQEVVQKGVDTLLVLDLVRLAMNRAYGTAVVVSGDRDIAEAVRVVGELGRRVVLLSPPEDRSVAAELRHLADRVVKLTDKQLRGLDRSRPTEDREVFDVPQSCQPVKLLVGSC